MKAKFLLLDFIVVVLLAWLLSICCFQWNCLSRVGTLRNYV